jgi:hypothetical protein
MIKFDITWITLVELSINCGYITWPTLVETSINYGGRNTISILKHKTITDVFLLTFP